MFQVVRVNQTFLNLPNYVLQIFSGGFSLPVWLTLKVFLLEPILRVLKSIMIFELSPELIISQSTLYSTL